MISTCRADIRPSSGMRRSPSVRPIDEPMLAEANDLAVGPAVVEDGQHRDRRPGRRPERAGRRAPSRWIGGSAAERRGRGLGRGNRRAGRPSLLPESNRLADVFLGLDQGAGPLHGWGRPGCRGDGLASGSIKVPSVPREGLGDRALGTEASFVSFLWPETLNQDLLILRKSALGFSMPAIVIGRPDIPTNSSTPDRLRDQGERLQVWKQIPPASRLVVNSVGRSWPCYGPTNLEAVPIKLIDAHVRLA